MTEETNTKNRIFTFWEGGELPDYLRLCLTTWRHEFILLNYQNLHHYTDLEINPNLTRFSLPQIADCVRTHVLRDQGGYWFDTDTIFLNDKLPTETVIGYPDLRTNTIGYLYAERPHMPIFDEWCEFQDRVINNPNADGVVRWSILSNDFTDPYVKRNKDITIADVSNCWPETYMVREDIHRQFKYVKFYFDNNYTLADINPTDMLMLHNSWTPDWYKKLEFSDVLAHKCTLSNILREVVKSC